MKKNIIIATIVTLIFNGIGFMINLICAITINTLPLSIAIVGGECVEHIGFGISLLELFPLTMMGESSNTTPEIGFNIISLMSLIIPLVLVFIITLIIAVIVNKKKNKQQ